MTDEQARLEAALSRGLPDGLEQRLRSLERLSGEAALGMEDLGRRASRALEQILVRGADAESVLARLTASLRDRVLRETLFRPLGEALAGAGTGLLPAGRLLAGASPAPAPAAAPGVGTLASTITINVSAPGGDPAQVRRSMGRAASELARVVSRGQRQL